MTEASTGAALAAQLGLVLPDTEAFALRGFEGTMANMRDLTHMVLLHHPQGSKAQTPQSSYLGPRVL